MPTLAHVALSTLPIPHTGCDAGWSFGYYRQSKNVVASKPDGRPPYWKVEFCNKLGRIPCKVLPRTVVPSTTHPHPHTRSPVLGPGALLHLWGPMLLRGHEPTRPQEKEE